MEENKEKKSLIEEGFVRKPDEPKTRNWLRTCKVCGREFYSVRKDCQFCSSYCRGRYWKHKMTDGTSQEEKTPTIAQKGEKKKLLGTYPGNGTWWQFDREHIWELRNWLKKHLNIGRSYTQSYIKTVKALEGISTDKVKYTLEKEKERNCPTVYKLYKIVQ